ncbi:YaeQ family protein [Tahibacter amnicola]|uniref:YaeQ family protein n=1 Tax=Tahibacter amnicola TaxID=2976241 RepID=A0ABY6BBB2_9GAMM|nr:YaeQ family protein [Tahibacter amnicola]UXI65921.1 YaeQ family protein [Tahibacter amnicola]
MALKATIYKAELQISDMDRHYYATHSLTLAQHPSETDERLMARLVAFALFADERLEFGRGLSTDDEPDLWRRELDGTITQWIEMGQPDESRLRRASGRADEVVVVTYGGRAADLWWEKNSAGLSRLRNLSVVSISTGDLAALGSLLSRTMRLQCLVQDGQVQLLSDTASITLQPRRRTSPGN